MKTLFGASIVVAGAAGVEIATGAGEGAGGGEPNVKEVPFDGTTGFAGSAGGGRSDGRLAEGGETDSTGFAGAPNVKGGAKDGAVVVGFSVTFGNVGRAAKVEEAAAESGVGVANVDIGRDGALNDDGAASAAFGTCGSGTSEGLGCSTAEAVRSEEGGVVIVGALAKTEELAKKFGIPVDAALDVGATDAGKVAASGASFIASGVGGMSAILGKAGAGVVRTGIGAGFTISAAGGAGEGPVRENGSEVIGGSFAWVKSCVRVIYKV